MINSTYKLLLVIFWIGCINSLSAQRPFEIMVDIMPPYPTSIHHYQEEFENNTFTVINHTETEHEIYLSAHLLGDNGVSVSFNPGYRPMEPFVVGPLGTIVVTGADLIEAYDGIGNDDLTYEGISFDNQITGQLPEGNYALCVVAIHYESGETLSSGCSFEFTNNFGTIPEIIMPYENEVVPLPEEIPLNILWSPPSQGPSGNTPLEYVMKLIDITDDPNVDLESIFDAGGVPPIVEEEVMGVSYLYNAEGDDPDLIAGHQYAIRVHAMSSMMDVDLDNMGKSEIRTFTIASNEEDEEQDDEEIAMDLPEDCESRCNIPNVTDSVALTNISSLPFIKIGHFQLFNHQLAATGNTFSGEAEIQLNFLNNVRMEVDVRNVKINAQGEIFEGRVRVKQEDFNSVGDLLGWTGSETIVETANSLASNLNDTLASNLGNALRTSRLLTSMAGLNSIGLPLAIEQAVKGTAITLGIMDIEISPQGAKAVVVAGMKMSQITGNNWIMVNADSVCIHPAGFGGEYTLSLGEDLHLNPNQDNSFAYELTLKSSGDFACSIEMNCNGIAGFQIGGEVAFPRHLIQPVSGSGNILDGKAKARFVFSEQRINADTTDVMGANWMAALDFDRFQLTKLKGWFFDINDAYLDYSDLANPDNINFPDNYSITDSTFQGVYIKSANLTPPSTMVNVQEEDVSTYVEISDVIIDPDLYMSIEAHNILDINQGSVDGWAFSMDTLGLNIFSNSLESAYLYGKMDLPILDSVTYLEYYALIYEGLPEDEEATDDDDESAGENVANNDMEDSDGSSYQYLFHTSFADTVKIPMMLAQGRILEDTRIDVMINPGDTTEGNRIHAMFHATIGINTEGMNVPAQIKLPQLDFMIGIDSREGIIDDETAISFGTVDVPDDDSPEENQDTAVVAKSKHIGGFPINMEEFNVEKKEGLAAGDLGFSFTMGISVDDGEEDLGGITAKFTIVGTQPEFGLDHIGQRLKKIKFKSISFNSIAIDINAGPVEMTGSLAFYDEEIPSGGRDKGIRGAVAAKVKLGVEVYGQLTLIFGNVGTVPEIASDHYSEDYYPYYYLDGRIMASEGIPIASGIALYGISGGISKNMVQDTVPKSTANGFVGRGEYNPEFEASGFGFGVTFGTHPSSEPFNADLSFKAQFRNGGIDMITIKGDGYVMCPIEKRDEPTVYVALEMTLLTQRVDRDFSMDGTLKVALNVANGILVGNMDNGTIDNQMVDASFHANAEDWSFFMGEPEYDYRDNTDPRASAHLSILTIEADMKMYLMIGHGVPTGLPPLPPEVKSILDNPGGDYEGTSASAANNGIGGADYSTGEGLATGAYLSVRSDIDAFLLYANLAVHIGFDMNITKRSTVCRQTNELIGINGWYGEGQAYAALKGEMGLQIKFLGKQSKFSLFELAAAIALSGGGPNPFYFMGRASVHYSILNGKLKGSSSFSIKIGDRCSALPTDPFAGINFFEEVTPHNGAENKFPGLSMHTKLALPVGEIYEIPQFEEDEEGNLITGTPLKYKPQLHINITKVNNNEVVPFDVMWIDDTERTQGYFTPQNSLEQFTQYRLHLKVDALDLNPGTPLRVKVYNENGIRTNQDWFQDTTITFTTGALPENIYQFVSITTPLPNERFFMQDDESKGYVFLMQHLDEAEDFYFPQSDENGDFEYYVRMTNLHTNESTDIPFQFRTNNGNQLLMSYMSSAKDYLRFDLPEMDNEAFHVLQVIRKRPFTPLELSRQVTGFKEIYTSSASGGSGRQTNKQGNNLEDKIEDGPLNKEDAGKTEINEEVSNEEGSFGNVVENGKQELQDVKIEGTQGAQNEGKVGSGKNASIVENESEFESNGNEARQAVREENEDFEISTTLEIEEERSLSPELVLKEGEILLYHTFFRTSKHNRMEDKLASANLFSSHYRGNRDNTNGQRIRAYYFLDEKFETSDLEDFTINEGGGGLPQNFTARLITLDRFRNGYHKNRVIPTFNTFMDNIDISDIPGQRVIDWNGNSTNFIQQVTSNGINPVYVYPRENITGATLGPIQSSEYNHLWDNYLLENDIIDSGQDAVTGALNNRTTSFGNVRIDFDTHFKVMKDKRNISIGFYFNYMTHLLKALALAEFASEDLRLREPIQTGFTLSGVTLDLPEGFVFDPKFELLLSRNKSIEHDQITFQPSNGRYLDLSIIDDITNEGIDISPDNALDTDNNPGYSATQSTTMGNWGATASTQTTLNYAASVPVTAQYINP